MSRLVAKEGDSIEGVDTHIVLVPSGPATVPTPLPHPFKGKLARALSETTYVDGEALAVEGAVAVNEPHVCQGASFVTPPKNEGVADRGSATIFVENKAVVRDGDPAKTCADPEDNPNSTVTVAAGSVYAG